jgi:glycine oxidase
MERLAAASHALQEDWIRLLQSLSGVDCELETGGAIYLARTRSELASLGGLRQSWQDEQIPHEVWNRDRIIAELPALTAAVKPADACQALFAPRDAQLRPPSLLRALRRACEHLGVRLLTDVALRRLEKLGAVVRGAELADGSRLIGDAYCISAGVWSSELWATIDVALPLAPIRGQVIAFDMPHRPFAPCVYEGGQYLVPRRDGLILVGSTLEDVGFDRGVTDEAARELSDFAASLLPELAGRRPTLAWSGLRPASYDGFPYLGRVPGVENLVVAAGHFRAGVHLSPITARVIVQILQNVDPDLDLTPFRVGRGETARGGRSA